ncbi:MAG: UDP-N-acetylmuramoyl-L-alanine--D-glutamate ligase [Spirochaetales bacterium]|nr:MAG: UDP-N-acetylmuramoyl-L-alanine--D-glutamate ligase [Spirochaetales bacterium]
MPITKLDDLRGLRVTVMGLGLNGGGLSTARFLAGAGAIVTVTDMKDEDALAESIAALGNLPIRYVLGRHDRADFSEADLVIKNPAVRPDSEFLRAARRVETDLSIFLSLCRTPIVAVTGSKGKSTTSSAIAHALSGAGIRSFLGGNITVSPFTFLDKAGPDDRIVLELSSWQLGDMKGMGVLKPHVCVLTRIVPDHLDRYGTMEAYVADKRLIYADQDRGDWTICDADDPYGPEFSAESAGSTLWYGRNAPADKPGARILEDGRCVANLPDVGLVEILPTRIAVPGAHNRSNLAAAGLAAWAAGADPASLAGSLASFPGVEHRLELFAERDGVRWCNDSAATVPQAVAAALEAFAEPVVLITGGTDKKLDFSPVREAYRRATEIILLAGSGTDKLLSLLDEDGIPYHGPFSDFGEAVRIAASLARPGWTVLLSPGCTSFGMFRNEFDRGRSFKAAVAELL